MTVEALTPNFSEIEDKVLDRIKNIEIIHKKDGGLYIMFDEELWKFSTKLLTSNGYNVRYYFKSVSDTFYEAERVIDFRLSTQSVAYDGFNNVKYARTQEEKKLLTQIKSRRHYLENTKPKRRKQAMEKLVDKPCVWCGTVFTPRINTEKTCCEECKKAYLRDYARKYREINKEKLQEQQRIRNENFKNNMTEEQRERIRQARADYEKSERGKARAKKYRESKKGQEALQRTLAKRKKK